jgi:hypothetical protein
MEPHQQRVVEEEKELNDKLSKLRQFLASQSFVGIQPEEQIRLIRQAQYMTQYVHVLQERIKAFKD